MNSHKQSFFTPLSELLHQLSHENFYWRIGFYALLIATVAHASFILLFAWVGLWQLMLLNVVSVGVYLFCIFVIGAHAIRTKNDQLIGWLVYAELLIHNTAACYYLGKDSGFQLYIYILAILPFFVFSYPRHVYWFRIGFVLFAAIAIETSPLFHAPKIDIDQTIIDSIHQLNVLIFLTVLSLISYLYTTHSTAYHMALREQNMTDPLSGLYNRRYIQEEFDHATTINNVAILLIDIDFFKTINDTYGHMCGDRVIKSVAQTIRNCLSEKNVVIARWGGEEFIVIYRNTTKHKLFFDAEFIRESIESDSITCSDVSLRVTVTIGGAYGKEERFDGLLSRADEALYLGKANGRNQVHIKE